MHGTLIDLGIWALTPTGKIASLEAKMDAGFVDVRDALDAHA